MAETGEIIKKNCPNKLYTFNRTPKLKFKTREAKSLAVQSREECQDRCLAEAEFLCRSAAFDSSTSTCFLNDLTQEMADPEMSSVDDDFDYMENTCVTGNSKCLGINRFIQGMYYKNRVDNDIIFFLKFPLFYLVKKEIIER